MNYYISDLYIGSKIVIDYWKRPYENMDEMITSFIENWNFSVNDDDTVYILGNLFDGEELNYTSILSKLKGKKILIKSFNDQKWLDDNSNLNEMFEGIYNSKIINDSGKKIMLSHYPIISWENKEDGVIHLYGKLNGLDSEEETFMYKLKNCYNVLTDYIGYTPRRLESILAYSSKEKDFINSLGYISDKNMYNIVRRFSNSYWEGYDKGVILGKKQTLKALTKEPIEGISNEFIQNLLNIDEDTFNKWLKEPEESEES